MLLSLLVQGGLFDHKTWLWTGDTIYHRAVMAEIRAGEWLPGGPYAGLPAFYSPLFHYMSVAAAGLLSVDLTEGIRAVSIVWAPLSPLVGYWLARTVGLERGAALLGAFFMTFGGGFRTSEDRVWVDALFVGQHNFFPVFPRDLAFLLLPLGFGLVYRGLVQGWRPGGYLAGVAFGLMVLAHTQTAVFAAPLMAIYVGAVLALRPGLWRRVLHVCVATSAVTLAVSAFWWGWMLWAIIKSGSFGVYMPAYRVPVKLSLAEFPLEFGIFLVLGPLGLFWATRRFVRERDLGMLLLLVWWLVPVLLAILRPTGFPGGDTFFPRRLWQFSSQPMVLLAGTTLLVYVINPLRLRGAVLGVFLVAVGLVAAVPNSIGTMNRIAEFWNEPSFGDQEWDPSGNFGFGRWLADRARAEGLTTVLAPTLESTLVWYYSGDKVVYLHPTAAIKLAFDVKRMTGFSESERQADQIRALSGSPRDLEVVAARYGARYVALKQQAGKLAGVDLSARALQPVADRARDGRLSDLNHYQLLAMNSGDSTELTINSPTDRTAAMVMRVKRRGARVPTAGALVVNGVSHSISDGELPRDTWADVRREVALRAGENVVRIESGAQLEILRLTAYTLTADDVPAGWRTVFDDGWYIVLQTR
jgi:hypothetical protein